MFPVEKRRFYGRTCTARFQRIRLPHTTRSPHFVEGTISPKYRAQLFMLMEGVIHSFCELLHTDCVQIWIGEVFISNIPEPECTDLCIFISSDSFNNADKHARG